MAVLAQELVETIRIRFERKLGDGVRTLGALPITLVHLPVELTIV